MVMEALSILIDKAKMGGYLFGWKVRGKGGEGVEVTHLLFADNTLIFCEPNVDQLMYLCWVHMWFETLSGLKINLEKSEIILVDNVENLNDLTQEFGCRISVLPSSYLGGSYKCGSVWDKDEEKLRRRLTLWKRQYLSKGGSNSN